MFVFFFFLRVVSFLVDFQFQVSERAREKDRKRSKTIEQQLQLFILEILMQKKKKGIKKKGRKTC